MEFTDDGIILGTRPHGEGHAIADVLTHQAGRISGLVHGGQGAKKRPTIQPGNGVQVTWKGRSETSLGHFAFDLTNPRAATLMSDSFALTALNAITSTLIACLSERESVPHLYEATCVLLDHLDQQSVWPVIYAKWELGVLENIGFALDLTKCVATGRLLEDGASLTFVSPKSGGAVCYEAGLPYKDKLFPLPPFLIDQGEPTKLEIVAALKLTGYFIETKLLEPAQKQLPEPRRRLLDRLERWAR
ncbi:MAG: DNA repair protein RecO [Parvularculaceae bacterium]